MRAGRVTVMHRKRFWNLNSREFEAVNFHGLGESHLTCAATGLH
jgi:hypothetical protein